MVYFLLLPFLCTFLNEIQNGVQPHRDYAQDYDGHQHPGQLKGLGTVDDEIPQTLAGTDKFSDDHADKAQSNIDFHHTQDEGHGRRKDDLCQFVFFCAAEGADKFQFLRVGFTETGVEIDDRAKDRHGYSGDDDRPDISTKPDDEKRGEGRFWQAVQDDEVRLQNTRKLRTAPQKNCCADPEKDSKHKADKRFHQCDPDMCKKRLILYHTKERPPDLRRTAEDKRIDPSPSGRHFPQKQKAQEQKNPGHMDQIFFTPDTKKVLFLSRGMFRHIDSAPSI